MLTKDERFIQKYLGEGHGYFGTADLAREKGIYSKEFDRRLNQVSDYIYHYFGAAMYSSQTVRKAIISTRGLPGFEYERPLKQFKLNR